MARIRSVHPGLFTDEQYVALSMTARVLLPGIWTEADDHGVFEWKPLTLKMKIFPADNVDVGALLDELSNADVVKKFTVDGKDYGAVRNFCRWQRPKKPVYVFELPDEMKIYIGFEEDNLEFLMRKEKCEQQGNRCYYCKNSITYYRKRVDSLELDHVIPKLSGGDDSNTNLVATCRSCNRAKGAKPESEFSEWLAKKGFRIANNPDNSAKEEQPPQMEEEGGNRMGRKKDSRAVADATRTGTFEEFWKTYPKRKGANPKDPARKLFEAAIKQGAEPAAIIAGARRCAADDRDKIGTPYIPQAVKWLRDRRWEDYQPPATAGPPQAPAGLPTDEELRKKYGQSGAVPTQAEAGSSNGTGADRGDELRPTGAEFRPGVRSF